METLGSFLDSLATAFGDAEAIAHAPQGVVTGRMTYHQLRATSRETARKLVALGVTKGTRVGLLCSNRLEWLPLAFGILRIGAILAPLSTLWKRDEIAYGLRHGDVSLLITLPSFLKHDYIADLNAIVPDLSQSEPGKLFSPHAPTLRRVVLLEGSATGMQNWTELQSELNDEIDDEILDSLERSVAPSEWATIFFTSGTTAQAKAVLHAHNALAVSARRIADCVGITTNDAWWGHMPLFWSGGFILGALSTLAGGGRIVLQEVVDAGSALELLEREHCTIMAGWHQAGPLLDHPDFAKRKLSLNKGSNHPLAIRLLGRHHNAVGMYGMSETATCVACARWNDPEPIRIGTFGKPLEGMEIKIVDPDTKAPVAGGVTGEILVKGPTLMEGYYKVARQQTFDTNGFFRTGDLGFLDDAGCLHFATRLKDVIKTAGVNVAAAEVEEALMRHSAVKAAHVVGVPHPVRGENIAAFVVLHADQNADEEILRELCRESLASYKVPRHVFIVADDDVPRTGSGKVEKSTLRKLATERVG